MSQLTELQGAMDALEPLITGWATGATGEPDLEAPAAALYKAVQDAMAQGMRIVLPGRPNGRTCRIVRWGAKSGRDRLWLRCWTGSHKADRVLPGSGRDAVFSLKFMLPAACVLLKKKQPKWISLYLKMMRKKKPIG